jgi:hypothetical protein
VLAEADPVRAMTTPACATPSSVPEMLYWPTGLDELQEARANRRRPAMIRGMKGPFGRPRSRLADSFNYQPLVNTHRDGHQLGTLCAESQFEVRL